MRLFFDYTTRDRAIYDYKGDEFLSLDDAFDFAETTAETMKHSLNGEWSGWSVEVRDAECKKYFSLPINLGQPAVTAASTAPDPPAKSPGSLLIIEDALIHSTVISRIARKAGFAVRRADTYEGALRSVAGAGVRLHHARPRAWRSRWSRCPAIPLHDPMHSANNHSQPVGPDRLR